MGIHQGDIGTRLRVTVMDGAAVMDLRTATTKEIVLRKPTGATVTKTAAFVTDGADGQIEYTTLAGDLDSDSMWQMQARVVLPSGAWRTDVAYFPVSSNL